MNIEIVSGSTREDSLTLRVALFLLRHLAEKFPQHNIGLIDLRKHDFPSVNKVYPTAGHAPEILQSIAGRMLDAHAFIMVTPEYNGTFSPALANLFDHFPKQSHKTFGIVTASEGQLGGIRAALAMQHFSLALYGIPSPQMLLVSNLTTTFDPQGNLLAAKFQNNIDNFVAEFIWLSEKIHGAAN